MPTTVSILTSVAPSAIAVLEVDGPLALDFVMRCWQPNQGPNSLQIDAIRYGFTKSESRSQGESVVVCRTGDKRIEMHCHGGRQASKTILQKLLSYGAFELLANARRPKDNDEFSREAAEDLQHSATLRTTAILLDQYRGALRREFETIRSMQCSNQFDEAERRLRQLDERSHAGKHLVEPWRVILAGPPNSGKSSLLNLLLGYTRAIVHEQAGTTRDLLVERSSFDGWPIELIDGAGIRAATDSIEATGIEQTLQRIAMADCTLLLVDRTTGWTEAHRQILDRCSGKVVLVVTKSDLSDATFGDASKAMNAIPESLSNRVDTSSVTGAGANELMNVVVAFLVPQVLQAGDPVPFRQRHRDAIAAMIESTGRGANRPTVLR